MFPFNNFYTYSIINERITAQKKKHPCLRIRKGCKGSDNYVSEIA